MLSVIPSHLSCSATAAKVRAWWSIFANIARIKSRFHSVMDLSYTKSIIFARRRPSILYTERSLVESCIDDKIFQIIGSVLEGFKKLVLTRFRKTYMVIRINKTRYNHIFFTTHRPSISKKS